MKRTINKRSLIIGISFLFCLLTFWNCEQEEPLTKITESQSHLKVERHQVAFDHLRFHNNKAYEIISKLVENKDKAVRLRGEDSYSEEHGIHYNLNKIYEIQGEDYQQFSFLVRTSDLEENQFQNYILIQYPDESFKQFIITYEYTSIEKDNYNLLSIRELEGDLLLNRSIGFCDNLPQLTPVTIETCTYSSCSGPGAGDHSWADRSQCNCYDMGSCTPPSRECNYSTQWVMTCPSGGDGSGDSGSGSNDDDNSNTGGGGSDNDNTGNGIPVVTVEEAPMDRILDCMNTYSIGGPNISMPQSLIDSLNGNSFCQLPLDEFIQEEGCSYENKVLAIDAARACLNDDEESFFEEHPELWVVYDEIPGRIADLDEYLKCFDNIPAGATFKFTVYIDQPVPNTTATFINHGSTFNPDIDPGHTFFSLSMNDGITSTNQTLGFYPKDGANPLSPNADGVWVDDGNHHYDVSVSMDLDSTQFVNLITTIKNFGTPTYNLNSLNCTDAAIQNANSAGMGLPDTSGSWPLGAGSNPGNLGQDARSITTPGVIVNEIPSTAPASNGPC